MKKVILMAAITLFGFTAAFAQDNVKKNNKADHQKLTAEQRAEKSTSELDKKLSLTADQKQKIYAIELDRAKKGEAKKSAVQAERKARKADMEADKAKIEQVLTPAQKTKLEALRAEKKAHKKDHKKGGRKDTGTTTPTQEQ